MSVLESLSEAGKKIDSVMQEVTEKAKAELAVELQKFMVEHPEIKAIGWTQYTPYFNDGDRCEFSVLGLNYSLVDEREDSFYGDGWNEAYGVRRDTNLRSDTAKDLEDLYEELCSSSVAPIMEAVFVDHSKVLVTQDGVEVEFYDHD